MKNQSNITDPVFYEDYKSLPKASRKRITEFRKRLINFMETPINTTYLFVKESSRIQMSTPVLRSQEDRKIGSMQMFSAKNNEKTIMAMKYFPTAGISKLKELPKPAKEISRMTISKKKLQRNAKLSGLLFVFKDENLHASPKRSTFGRREFSQKNHELLLINRAKLEKSKIKEKMKKAVKYLVGIANKRKAILRGGTSLEIPEREEKMQEAPINKPNSIEIPMIVIHEIDNPNKDQANEKKNVKDNYESDDIHRVKKGTLLSARGTKRENAKQRRRNTISAANNMNTLIGALEQLALAPIKIND